MPELVIASIIILVGFVYYSLFFPPTYKFNGRRKLVNVRYFCSTHLAEGLKDNKFVILKDVYCETCEKIRKEQGRRK